LLPVANPTKPSLKWLVCSETCPIGHEYSPALACLATTIVFCGAIVARGYGDQRAPNPCLLAWVIP